MKQQGELDEAWAEQKNVRVVQLRFRFQRNEFECSDAGLEVGEGSSGCVENTGSTTRMCKYESKTSEVGDEARQVVIA